MRASLIGLIYAKISKVSLHSINRLSIGRVVNVVANDVNAFERNGPFIYFLVLAPPFLVVATIMLYILIGPSCFAGIGWILITYPL